MGLRTDFGADVEGAGPLGAHAEGLGAVVKVEFDGVTAVDAAADSLKVRVAARIGALGVRKGDLINRMARGLVAVLGLPVGRVGLHQQLLVDARDRDVRHRFPLGAILIHLHDAALGPLPAAAVDAQVPDRLILRCLRFFDGCGRQVGGDVGYSLGRHRWVRGRPKIGPMASEPLRYLPL